MEKCRVFKASVGWSDGLFFINENITFKEIKNNPSTSFLEKKHYLGIFDFDENFLKIFQHKKINNKNIYFDYIWERYRLDGINNKNIDI
ncbi:MAG: hypothetical protein ACOC4B_02425 [Bacteroidota bacterium]